MIESIERMTLFFHDDGVIRSTLTLIIYLLYFLLMTKMTSVQTVEKMIFGIRIIALNEKD